MTYHAPWKNMRQVAAELQSKRQALNDAKWRQVKNEIKIKKLEEKLGKELDYWSEVETKVKLAQLKEGMAEGITYIEGAMKDVIALGEIYENMQKQVESLTEEEFEKSEAESHLKRSLVQCIRDVRQYGSISKGEQEYLEQIGANPAKLQAVMRGFVEHETKCEDWSTKPLQLFVDDLCNDLLNVHKVNEDRVGFLGFQESTDKSLCYDKLGEEDASN
jgi:predicted  nucleic acid-binding Zn-ribbon protein